MELSAKLLIINPNNSIAIADLLFNEVYWLRNDGLGNFSEKEYLRDDFALAVSTELGDLDLDGDLDIIFSATTSPEIIVALNDGSGNFSEMPPVQAVGGPNGLSIADIDDDGKPDIICSSISSGPLLWLKGNSDGTFVTGSTINSDLFGAKGTIIVDFDNDGDLDVSTVHSATGGVSIFLNSQNGQSWERINLGSNFYKGRQAAASDFDDDGDIDIVSVSAAVPSAYFFENLGDGNFATESLLNSTNIFFLGVTAVDLDGDGFAEIITSSDVDNSVVSFQNDGLGNFTVLQNITEDNGSCKMIFNDSDGDGDQDLLSFELGENRKVVYKNDGQGGFTEKINSGAASGSVPVKIEIADIDNDFIDDFIEFYPEDKNIKWSSGDGNGSFSDANVLDVSEFYELTNQFIVEDLDMDGDNDFIFAAVPVEDDYPKIYFYSNEGGGSFSQSVLIDDATDFFLDEQSYQKLIAKDMDNDGDIDILTASSIDYYNSVEKLNIITLFRNDGNTDFSEKNIISTAGMDFNLNTPNILTEDLNGDNFQDVVVKITELGLIYYLANDGSGNFSNIESDRIPISGQDADLSSYTLADLDSDNDIDVLAYSTSSKRLIWFVNEGEGIFNSISGGLTLDVNSSYNIIEIQVIDITNDGKPEVVCELEESQILFYENLTDYRKITGKVFWDYNQDGEQNENDEGLQHSNVYLSPSEVFSYTEIDGNYSFFAAPGNYELTYEEDECLSLTSEASSYSVEMTDTDISNLDFGVYSNSEAKGVTTTLVSAPTRCGFSVPFWLNVKNSGCVPLAGKVGYILDANVNLISNSQEPDETENGTIFWYFENLLPGNNFEIKMTLQMPGINFIGQYYNFETITYCTEADGSESLLNEHIYTSQINCAYDPNDKLVFPDRTETYGATLTKLGEDIQYTVRFQNTGTDTAFNVFILDHLDPFLDWNTFQPLAASHPYEVLRQENGTIKFSFPNILLPDSTVNELSSHGFVTYNISQNPGLEVGEIIKNTAEIYFDFNPPIITNTTYSFLSDEIIDSTDSTEIVQKNEFTANPNPFDNHVDFTFLGNQIPPNSHLMITDVTGKIVFAHNFTDNSLTADTSHLSNGIYFYTIFSNTEKIKAQGKIVRLSR